MGATLDRILTRNEGGSAGILKWDAYERMKHKGVTEAGAVALAEKPVWFAAGLVAIGAADASVAGAATDTAQVLRAGIRMVGTAAGVRSVSSSFLMVRRRRSASWICVQSSSVARV